LTRVRLTYNNIGHNVEGKLRKRFGQGLILFG
jgi:hypothetical protein